MTMTEPRRERQNEEGREERREDEGSQGEGMKKGGKKRKSIRQIYKTSQNCDNFQFLTFLY